MLVPSAVQQITQFFRGGLSFSFKEIIASGKNPASLGSRISAGGKVHSWGARTADREAED